MSEAGSSVAAVMAGREGMPAQSRAAAGPPTFLLMLLAGSAPLSCMSALSSAWAACRDSYKDVLKVGSGEKLLG